MSGKGMLCGGNTVIMCGTCNMGRKFFSVGPTFSVPPPLLGGDHPQKNNIPPGIKKIFLPSPPSWVATNQVTKVFVHRPPFIFFYCKVQGVHSPVLLLLNFHLLAAPLPLPLPQFPTPGALGATASDIPAQLQLGPSLLGMHGHLYRPKLAQPTSSEVLSKTCLLFTCHFSDAAGVMFVLHSELRLAMEPFSGSSHVLGFFWSAFTSRDNMSPRGDDLLFPLGGWMIAHRTSGGQLHWGVGDGTGVPLWR